MKVFELQKYYFHRIFKILLIILNVCIDHNSVLMTKQIITFEVFWVLIKQVFQKYIIFRKSMIQEIKSVFRFHISANSYKTKLYFSAFKSHKYYINI